MDERTKKRLRCPAELKKEEFRRLLKELIETSDFKENHDLIDTEMIQLAIMGYGGQPVHFYTKDSSDKIKKRLLMFHFLLRILIPECQERLRESVSPLKLKNVSVEKMQSIASLNFHFGKISIIDNTGNIKDHIDVKDLFSQERITF